ncbi:MAG: AraC family transcriptional regulator [Methyloligellaceae bacterium]
MHKERTTEDYKSRILRVIDYIYNHLDSDLDSRTLSEIACFSEFHWHRIYHSMTGETPFQTVRRLRLHRASGELLSTDAPVIQIAERAGYNSIEAFNRAFKKAFQLPPAAYRQSREKSYALCNFIEGEDGMYDVEVKDIEAITIAAVHYKGSYMESGQAFEQLMTWAGPKGLINETTRMIGVYYDDPNEVPEEELRTDAGIAVSDNLEVQNPIRLVNIERGTYAVLLHKGPYAELSKAYAWLFGQWLPQSGREAANRPCFEEYLNNPKETNPGDLQTLICLPLG